MKYDTQILNEGCRQMGISLTEEQTEQFMLYYEKLIEVNRVMNLTAITEFEDVMRKHFLDSLTLVKAADIKNVKRVLDLGTGAGFPGIPLKIAFPDTEFVLLDSLNKRVKFLHNIIELCRLKKIQAVHGRAEELAGKKEYRESFDLCVSRAVANLSSLSEYCLPYVEKGGLFVSYKSGNIQEELEAAGYAIQILGGRIKDTVKFKLPGSDMDRSLVVIEKIRETPARYPRRAGIPSREPLMRK
ncbi:MAG TPA: 16S rRNA (guanine(527)-N(7))-methyltransferase RsmG [Candidatus Blautia merdigallinarum]|uniref:Ribosomal RNA small subunit methyltransferase G n=1 Tax=Candidatus Blautia merdigallinarum TaxID=2838495 RepID=A0A9D2SJR4_9FIRM|nr:16S rRNA (guanine(527)-N(7))-methyltransferase RsmG [Candidatus Blautia merdigallinarum]